MDYYEELQLKNLELKRLVFEALQFIRSDMEGLKDGISVNGRLSALAEDEAILAEIRAMEVWMARAKIELGVTGGGAGQPVGARQKDSVGARPETDGGAKK